MCLERFDKKNRVVDVPVFCNYDCHVSVDLHRQHECVCNVSNRCIIFKKSIDDMLVNNINSCVPRSKERSVRICVNVNSNFFC